MIARQSSVDRCGVEGASRAPTLARVTVVVKLGSSIVADDGGELRGEMLDSICAQVATVRGRGEGVVLITSGAIARGVRLLGLSARPGAIDALQAASAVGQGSLFRAYEERLGRQELRAAQVLLTAADVSARINYVNARQTLTRLLEWGVIPVVNENDTTATDEITFGDNDFLSAQVAMMLEARMLVLLTDLAGLHTADPGRDPDAELIEEVRDFADLDELEIGEWTSTFGSGGMRSKVVAAEMARGAGIPVVICDGTEAGMLERAVSGEAVGTRFAPHADRAPGFKVWLRYATPAKGRLVVDAGAAKVLRERGSSLLPVGITAVEGDFSAGDPVEVVSDGEVVGKGIASHSAAELHRARGKKSGDLDEVLAAGGREAVHRDNFVLT